MGHESLRPLPKRGVKVPERLVAYDIYVNLDGASEFDSNCCHIFEIEMETQVQELMIWQLIDAEPDFEDRVQVREESLKSMRTWPRGFCCLRCENHWLATFSLST